MGAYEMRAPLSPEMALMASFRTPHIDPGLAPELRDELLDVPSVLVGLSPTLRSGAVAVLGRWLRAVRTVVPGLRAPKGGAGVA